MPAGRRLRHSIARIAPTLVIVLALGLAGVVPLLVGGASLPARAAGVPPPTPVPPKGKPSPFPTALHTPPPGHRPVIPAASAILVDLNTGQELYEKRPDVHRPIASITKIMTALIVLEQMKTSDVVTVRADAEPPKNLVGLSALGLQAGETLTVNQLLYALMLQSANDAAVALADAEAGSQAAFVQEMNRRAAQLGMHDTHLESPNGLNDEGYSTATDLVTLTQAAMANPKFAKIVHTKEYTLPGPEKGDLRHVQNRNVLLWLYPGATGVKTGYTNLARYCVVATAERDGRRLAAVVLGSPGEEFSDAAELLNYGFTQFDPQTVISKGKDFGERVIGDYRADLVAGEDLTALVPSGEQPHITEHAVVDASAADHAVVEGARVGSVVATLSGETLGRVPLVATSVERLEAPAGTWWSRALTTLGHAFADAVNGVFT